MENHLIPMDHDACGVGFVTQLGGTGSHEVVERALEALKRLAHRGGVDADGRSGDGAGLLISIPEKFIRTCARQAGMDLPAHFGLGMVFLPRLGEGPARDLIEAHAGRLGLHCLGWRTVPTDSSIVGPRASETLPRIRQCFFAPLRCLGSAKKWRPTLRGEPIFVRCLLERWSIRDFSHRINFRLSTLI